MILLLSQASFEYSTNVIIDYLDLFGADYLRINGDDLLVPGELQIDIVENTIKIKNKIVDFSDISIVFNRRWWDSERYFSEILSNGEYDPKSVNHIVASLTDEFRTISEFFVNSIPDCLWIPQKKNVNKLVALQAAQDIGLTIPQTKILTCKDDLVDFMGRYGRTISKSISDLRSVNIGTDTFSYMTKEILPGDIEHLPTRFFPSLFQEMIAKEYEIRVFYFLGEFFSMAIFSQNDTQTSVDFRNYNIEKPNRTVPYELPESVRLKIDALMNKLNLNTGSLDLIKSKNGDYVFLEINPVGQFGMVSNPNNYNLHKIIAQKLAEYDTASKLAE